MKNLSTKKIEKYSRQIIMKEVGINGQKKFVDHLFVLLVVEDWVPLQHNI